MKAMLSCNTLPNIDTEIPYPCLASPKLDGIRGMIYQGRLVSRSLKDLPNLHLQEWARRYGAEMEGLDGELTLRNRPHDFNACQSAFMTHEGEPDFIFNVFDDRTNVTTGARARKALMHRRVQELMSVGHECLDWCPQYTLDTPELVRDFYTTVRAQGYEGLIIMHPDKPYKFGRSTLKQQISLKLKPCNDAEAVITGMYELMNNLDAGNSKRKENLVPSGMMGGLLALTPEGINIRVGGGFTHAQRTHMWENQNEYINKTFTYKFMETFKDTGAPRGAIFKGLRYE